MKVGLWAQKHIRQYYRTEKIYINPTLGYMDDEFIFKIKYEHTYVNAWLDRWSLLSTKELYCAWMKFIQKYVIENIEDGEYYLNDYKVFDMLIYNKYCFTDASCIKYGKYAFKAYDKKGNLILCTISNYPHKDFKYNRRSKTLEMVGPDGFLCNYDASLFDCGVINVYSSILIADLRRIAGCKYDVDREILRLREYPRAIADELVDIAT